MEWRKRKKDNFFLTLDIGTEAVKTLIFCASSLDKPSFEGKKIIILGTGLEYFDRDGVFDSRDFEAGVIKRAISKAIEKAYQNLSFSLAKKELKEKAQKQKRWKILLGLPSNLLKGRIVYQSFSREKPREKISKKEEEVIYRHILEAAKKEISQRFAEEFGILSKDIHWISLKILGIKIDGYLVSSLKGYEGKDLEFRILTTFLPKYYWENIKKIIGSLPLTIFQGDGSNKQITQKMVRGLEFEIIRIVHLAESLPILCKSKKNDGIFLDVGGEITQIFEIKNSKLQKIDEFKGGGRAFTQSLSQRLGLDEETTRIMEEKYSKKLLSSGAMKTIKEIFFWERKVWYDSLKFKLKKMNPQGIFSSTIFLFGGGSSSPEIQGILEKEAVVDWKNLPISGPPKVEFLYPEDLDNIEDTTKILNKTQSIPSLLICYAIIDYQ